MHCRLRIKDQAEKKSEYIEICMKSQLFLCWNLHALW